METSWAVLVRIFNAKYVNGFDVIKSADLVIWAANSGRFAKIVLDTEKGATASTKSTASAFLELMRRSDMVLDLRKSSHSELVNRLVSNNTLTNADKVSLRTLSTVQVSRAFELWEQNISINDIRGVR